MKRIVLKSKKLQMYQFLKGRMSFSQKDKAAYYNETQGYKGERKLEKLLKSRLTINHIPLYGLLLDNQGTLFQIDCLLIFSQQAIMIEVKYYQSEFEFRDDRLFSLTSNKYYQHPLHQLQRTENNLQELLYKLNINIPLKPFVAFTHDEFTLFANKNPAIILPTQLNTFMKKLQQLSGDIHSKHQKLAEKLESLHLDESPFIQIPTFTFKGLHKGVLCRDCRERLLKNRKKLYCPYCSYEESIDSGILRSVIEFHTLFPKKKLTTKNISEWCGLEMSVKSMRRKLSKYLQHHMNTSASFFTFRK